MKKLLVSMLLVGAMCGVANADYVTVADWQFNGTDWLADSSGNGYTLSNYAVTEGTDTAVFNGASQLWTPAGNTLDLTPYRQVRVTFKVKTATEAIGIVFEHDNIANNGALIATVNENAVGVGVPGTNLYGDYNNQPTTHLNYVWQTIIVEVDLDSATAADVVRTWVEGVEQANAGIQGATDPENESFLNAIFCIGARNGPALGLNGEIDYLTVAGQIPEPATMALLGFGGIMVLVRRRRQIS